MKKILCIIFVLTNGLVWSQQQRRYLDTLYGAFDTIKNIQFGHAINLKGEDEKLYLDFYQPHGDKIKKRPLVVFVHGGGYTGGDKATGYPMTFTNGLCKRGYTVASINYRLGLEEPRTDTVYFESMIRALQDAKTAIRYIRAHATQYRIDPEKIIIMGGSAGAHSVLHLAYLDENELPGYYDKNKLGSFEGAGNEGVSSKVAAVINCWGAIIDMHWINKGDIPFFGIHGAKDVLVPVDSSDLTHGFKYGSRALYHHAQSLGIYSGMKIYEDLGHTLDNNILKQREALDAACRWLYKLVEN